MKQQEAHILKKYLPESSIKKVVSLFEQYPCHLKIVNARKTKHGDFKVLPGGRFQISINYNLNPYRFLLTLIHELAHLVTYRQYGRVKPHGEEWKQTFRELMLPFLHPAVFPENLLPFLANYLRNPRASTDTDLKLSMALKDFDEKNEASLIYEIPENSRFVYNNRVYQKGKKRRTRHECIDMQSGKKYLFHQHAEVKLVEN